MEFSFWPSTAQPWSDLLRGCQWAESQGWHGVWVPDHFMANVPVGIEPGSEQWGHELSPWLESWTTQAAIAALVPRVRIGAMVSGNLYRHPAVVASMAGTIDEISGGRFVVGIGAGWQENEHARYGLELTEPGVRSDQLEEACLVIRGLLDNDRTSFAGQHYVLDGAPCAPSGLDRRIPLLVGGGGELRTLRTVARHADEWNVWATPAQVGPKRQVIERWCEEIGRDPTEIRITISAMTRFCESAGQRDRVLGRLGNHGGLVGAGVEEIRAAAGAYAEAGVDELVIADFNLPLDHREDVLGRLQAEVLDEFR